VFLVISNRHPRRSNSSVASPFQFNRLRSIRVISGVNFYQDATAATANALCCILFLVSLAQVVETESACEALHKELSGLQRRRAELEEELRVKEKGYQLALDESRRSEKRLDDQRQRLEASLDNAGAELSETRLRLSAADGRITALEAQLARVEAGRGEIEGKLTSIVSDLRRYIGFSGGVRSYSISQLRARSPSPVRNRPAVPTKGMLTYLVAVVYCASSIDDALSGHAMQPLHACCSCLLRFRGMLSLN
jgi:hypothetical protein